MLRERGCESDAVCRLLETIYLIHTHPSRPLHAYQTDQKAWSDEREVAWWEVWELRRACHLSNTVLVTRSRCWHLTASLTLSHYTIHTTSYSLTWPAFSLVIMLEFLAISSSNRTWVKILTSQREVLRPLCLPVWFGVTDVRPNSLPFLSDLCPTRWLENSVFHITTNPVKDQHSGRSSEVTFYMSNITSDANILTILQALISSQWTDCTVV